jgi:hypothetical protein
MRFAPWFRGCLAVGLVVGIATPGAVSGSAVAFLDHLIITRNLTPLAGQPGALGTYEGAGIFYADFFGDGLEPPSGGLFFGPSPGTYFLQFGAYGSSDESGGKLRLDSALGSPATNAAGQGRLAQQVTLTSSTNTGQSVQGLIQEFHTFSVYGLFDLTALTLPPNPGDVYGIQIQDNALGLASTEELAIQLRRNADNSLSIRSFQQNFAGGVLTVLDDDLLVVPAGADQIEFRLQRATLGSDLVTAAYRFWDNGSPLTAFTVMDNPTDFFNNRGWARAGFRASEALVPEPDTFALLFGALGVLILAVRRRSS